MGQPGDLLIGGFRVLAEIKAGVGAQGTVYKAVCESDDYPACPRGTVVALKTMKPGADGDRQFEKLRLRSAALASLDHPNVVRYLCCFIDQSGFGDMHAVVQEYLDGETLKSRLERCPVGLDVDEGLKVVSGVVSGLAAAVAKGIVHRDIKPGNIFLCSDGGVKLIDFEVAEQTGVTTSVSGKMIGSFDYMAPDFTDPHFSGDEKSDIFSVGAVMHEVFTGRLPYQRFSGSSHKASFAFLDRWARDGSGKFIKGECVIASSVERVLAHAKTVLAKALALNRAHRFGTFVEFAEALGQIRFRDLRNGEMSYRILQQVGKGGFGEVFKTRANGRTFAVKHLIKPEYATRFLREAKIMSQLDDSCFVRFFDFFMLEHSGINEAFLVMDFLPGMPGSSLRDAIRRSAGCGIDRSSVMKAFARYAHGLKVIHARGIYHRDIKPTNLYFPEDRPDTAAIMDLGIARDESGTETTGQVPGTLDYMPPETALGEGRGDAGMDIYALGLCFYEALTGKKGFPRLPSGSAAFAQFFKRAKERTRPTFDDSRVLSFPGLLSLLERMTDPDPARRLSDAGRLEKEILALVDGSYAGDMSDAATGGTTLLSTAGRPAGGDEDTYDEETTGETAFVPQSAVSRAAVKAIDNGLRRLGDGNSGDRRRKAALVSAALLAFAAVIAVVVFWPQISGWLDRFALPSMQGGAAISQSSALVEGEEIGIADLYGDDTVPIAKVDELRDRWLADRKAALSEYEYERVRGLLERSREQRVIRDRLDSERSRLENDVRAVVEAYGKKGIPAGDEMRQKWLADWKSAPKSRIDGAVEQFDAARKARQKYDASKALMPEATKAAELVARSYSENGIKIADREQAAWESEWSAKLTDEDGQKLLGMMAAARHRVLEMIAAAERSNAAKALVDECRALAMMLVPVESRKGRLSEAETKLRQGVEGGIIDADTRDTFLQEVEWYRKLIVFEIENRSDLDLEVGSSALKNGASRVFVFTNSVPAGLSAECRGYEPFAIDAHMDGRKVRLLPEHFAMLKVEVATGNFPDGVGCRIDNVSVKSGVVRLMPGTHICVYFRQDYKNQTIPFRVEPGKPTRLPFPGTWVRSDDWIRRDRDSKRAELAARIERDCAELLADEPVATRAERLAKCGSLLREWTTPDALGEERLRELTQALRRAGDRVIGAVVNSSGRELVLEIAAGSRVIADGERMLVDFQAGAPIYATLSADGCEPIVLPVDFIGRDFTVSPDMLHQAKVKVPMPKLPEGVTCLVDGVVVSGTAEVLPGSHVYTFRRPDYADIQGSFVVVAGEQPEISAPYRWDASESMVSLVKAEAAADVGDWAGARALFEQADVKGEEGLKRKMALGVRMESHKRFVKRIDAATAAYMESRWKDVIRSYADLKLDGYEVTPQDGARLNDAFKGIDDDLEMRGRALVREPDEMGEAKLRADRKWVENMKVLLQFRK